LKNSELWYSEEQLNLQNLVTEKFHLNHDERVLTLFGKSSLVEPSLLLEFVASEVGALNGNPEGMISGELGSVEERRQRAELKEPGATQAVYYKSIVPVHCQVILKP